MSDSQGLTIAIHNMSLLSQAVADRDIEGVKWYQSQGVCLFPSLMDTACKHADYKMAKYLESQGLKLNSEHLKKLLEYGDLEVVKSSRLEDNVAYNIGSKYPIKTILYLCNKNYKLGLYTLQDIIKRFSQKYSVHSDLEYIVTKVILERSIEEFYYNPEFLRNNEWVYYIHSVREHLHKIQNSKRSIRWRESSKREVVDAILNNFRDNVQKLRDACDLLTSWLPMDICKYVIPDYF
jgi:hypothetical protein